MDWINAAARRVVVCLLAVLFAATASSASAQGTGAVEIGTSLVSLTVLSPNQGTTETLFGVPSGSFGLVGPGLYLSIFASPRVAVEPQLGLVVEHSGGQTSHLLNFAGQIDYFVNGAASSPYLFAGAGIVDVTGDSTNPKIFDFGVGYRSRVGTRLTFRVDGRYLHLTDNGGNGAAFTVSIGGLVKQ